MASDKILEKIRKLLNLGDANKNDSEEECNRAMQKAQQLLLDHKLSLSDIELHTEVQKVIEEDIRTNKVQINRWHMRLLDSLCDVFHGTYLVHPGNGAYSVIASESNMQIIKYFFGYLVNVINSLSDDKFQEYQNSGGIEHGKSWKNAFRIGCSRRVGDRMREEHKVLYTSSENSQQTGLVKLERAAVDAFKAKQYPKLSSYRASKNKLSSSGYYSGQKAGNSVSLHKGVGTSGNTQKYLGA